MGQSKENMGQCDTMWGWSNVTMGQSKDNMGQCETMWGWSNVTMGQSKDNMGQCEYNVGGVEQCNVGHHGPE